MYLRKCIENHAIFQKYKRQKHCMFKVIFPKVPSQNKENKVSYLGTVKLGDKERFDEEWC